MKSALLGRRGLVALNLALLAGLAVATWVPLAGAQNGVQGRARGDYTMVAGKTPAGGSSAVYIVDSSNQEMVALRWDQGKQQMVGLGYRTLTGDSRTIPGR